ncbi:hypothetical protein BDZ94DRAFT_1366744, partial [Collybia nuda]
MLIWIICALSPQEIRDRLKNQDSEFQKALVDYLEKAHIGELLTGSLKDIQQKPIICSNIEDNYEDPTQTMPIPPPKSCKVYCNKCEECMTLEFWKNQYCKIVDDIIIRSNVHTWCLNRDGVCTARFPREIVPNTTVNTEDGHIDMKKRESMINTVTPALTYLMRCNTDVTSLLSGTSIKAVVAYVSDYVSKQSLKTYHIFATIADILDKK